MPSYNVAGLHACARTRTYPVSYLAARYLPEKQDRHSLPHMGGSSQPTSAERRARQSPSLMLCSCSCLPILFCLLWAAVSADLPPVDECAPEPCGDGLNVSFPFWIEERQHPWCGYPAFNISCEDKATTPFIKISGKKFVVEDIFYENQSFTLSDPELYSYEGCPVAQDNLSLDATQFKLSSHNRYLFYFLDCLERQLSNLIDCKTNGKFYSYVDINQSSSDLGGVAKQGSCESFVSWPYWDDGDGNQDYKTLQKKGFLLSWDGVVNCSVCKESDGSCRYNVSRGSFSCACSDREHAISCTAPRDKKKKKAAIGVGAGVGGFLLSSLLCFILYRRKRVKARAVSSTLLFPSTSSDFSSRKDLEMAGSVHYPTHLFKYEELSEATDGFNEANELGDGGFGTVYKGKLRDGRIVAVKRLYENNYKRVEQFMNEVVILNRLQHPNLVSLYGCTSRHSRGLLLVYEYVPNGTVADHLHGDRAPEGLLSWSVRLNIAIETATALAYLHKVEPQIIHRDVKTNNILLDHDFHVKVADFGLSRLFPMDATHVSTAPQGTPGYVDPEYHQCYQLTDKSDVYSFGVVLVELISSMPAVDITRHRHDINLANMAMSKIQNGALHELVDPTLGFDTNWEVRRMINLVAELAFRCLQAEREMRPSMEDVVEALLGIRGDTAMGDMDQAAVRDDQSLLKHKVPFSPDSVMDKWASRMTTPNTSA